MLLKFLVFFFIITFFMIASRDKLFLKKVMPHNLRDYWFLEIVMITLAYRFHCEISHHFERSGRIGAPLYHRRFYLAGMHPDGMAGAGGCKALRGLRPFITRPVISCESASNP